MEGSPRSPAGASLTVEPDPAPAPPPETEPDELAGDELADVLAAGVTPEAVESILAAQGEITNRILAPGSERWRWDRGELDLVAPAAARIAARSKIARAVAGQSDAISVLAGVGLYLLRNIGADAPDDSEVSGEEASTRGDARPAPAAGDDGDRPTPAFPSAGSDTR